MYTDASDDACRALLSQEHNGTEFPIAFLLHTFWEHKENGAQQNKKFREFTMPLQNGTVISREQRL